MRFPHSATIEALTPVGSKSSYISAGTTECFLQQLDNESAIQYAIIMSKAFACYLPITSTVEEGNRLEISGTKYSVKAVKPLPYGTFTKHKKAILEMKV